jgi:hypothetical protein
VHAYPQTTGLLEEEERVAMCYPRHLLKVSLLFKIVSDGDGVFECHSLSWFVRPRFSSLWRFVETRISTVLADAVGSLRGVGILGAELSPGIFKWADCRAQKMMETADNCEYMLLGFAPLKDEASTLSCIAVARNLATNAIHVSVKTSWLSSLPDDHRTYTLALVEDWSNRRGHMVTELFQQLPNLSVGPLRYLRSGRCSVHGLDQLLTADQ